MSFKRVLIAVDQSPVATRAVDVGLELARSLSAEAAFVHAVDPALAYAPEGGVPAPTLLSLAEQDGKRLLSELRARTAFRPAPQEFLSVGKPGEEVVTSARNWAADVIVIGSHGRVGVTRLLVGSVAEFVMRHAPCPVLVVRAPL